LAFRPGEKFLLKGSVDWEEYHPQQRKFLEGKKIVVTVDHFQIDNEAGIGYVLKFDTPKDYDWNWFVTEEFMETNFIKLDRNPSKNRFLFMR